MKCIDVESLINKVGQFNSERDWSQFHSIKNLSMALSVETSELVEIFQWLKEEESNKISENEILKKRVGEEIADVFLYLIQIAHKAGVDIEAAVELKMQANELKYPVDKAKGSALKYTELKD